MDNMAYLQQIAAKPTDAGPSGFDLSKLLTPKNLLIGGGILVFLIILIVVAAIFAGDGGDKTADALNHALLRGRTITVNVEKYRKRLKSSDLRTMSSTLSSIIGETDTNIATAGFVAIDGEGNISASEAVTTAESADAEALATTLENARLNALLDRTFIREITLQIAIYRSYLTETLARTDDANLKAIITNSLTNLDKVYLDFQSFSDKTN